MTKSRAQASKPVFAAPAGTMPVLQYVLPDSLAIDASYQRSIDNEDSQRLIRSIAQSWNWDLCQPLVVSRRDDGALYVIDGQHRLAAARLRGDIAQLPSVIVSYADERAEAASFVSLNQQRRPLAKLDLFRAAIASGDGEASAILAAMHGAGLTLAPHSNPTAWKPGMVANIGGIEVIWRRHGPRVTGEALHLMAAAFAGQVLQYAGTIWPGVAAVAKALADGTGAIAPGAFAAAQAKIGAVAQTEWRRRVLRIRADETMAAGPAAEAALLRHLWPDRYRAKPARVVTPRAAAAPSAIVAVPVDADGCAWCAQCDRRVKPQAVATCASRYCSFRKAAA